MGKQMEEDFREAMQYQRIHELHEGGMSLRKIGEELSVARNTVRKYAPRRRQSHLCRRHGPCEQGNRI